MPIPNFLKSLRARIGHELLLVPGACGLVFNERDEILLHRRSDTGRWALIGGMIEPGEEPADAVVREVFEETGVRVVPERITGVYSTPVVEYPNGDQMQYIITTFRCRPVEGEPRVNDDESLEVRYFPLDALPELRPDHVRRIEHARHGGVNGGQVFFTPPRS